MNESKAREKAKAILERLDVLRLIHDKQIRIAQAENEVTAIILSCFPEAATPQPESPSGRAWRKWFSQLGELATVHVVNATATLVIEEREIALARVREAPHEPEGEALAIAEIRERARNPLAYTFADYKSDIKTLLDALARVREGEQKDQGRDALI